MTKSFEDDWRKELNLLLERIETHPSADLSAERERVAVLRQLLADLARTPVGLALLDARGVTVHDRAMTAGSDEVDAAIAGVEGWRGAALARVRALIRTALPQATEAVKWRKPANPAGVPVWEQDGLICTGETYKDKVKLTFAQGASLEDPSALFNGADTGKVRRSIDLREGEELDGAAFKALVRAAAAFNAGKGKR